MTTALDGLWAHQIKGYHLVRDEFKRGNKWVCLVMSTGAGKTRAGCAFVRAHLEKNPSGKVLWIAHRDELVGQAYDTLTGNGLDCGVIQATPSRPVNPHRPVQIASVQTLVARQLHLDGVSLFVYDECFVAGTLVDGRPIETITPGDIVTAVDHNTGELVRRRVTRVFKNRPTSLVRVNDLVCTPGHPFYVPGEGYVPAYGLEGKWIVRGLRWPDCGEAQDVWSRVLSQEHFGANDAHECKVQSSEVPPRADARCSQSNAGRIDEGQSLCNSESNRTQAADSRWQRQAAADTSEATLEHDSRLRNGVLGSHGPQQGTGGAVRLEDRRCNRRCEVGDRSRRTLSRCSRPAGAGSQEGGVPYLERVDRVEVLEPGADGTYGGMCPDGFVYNLEVEEHHNYLAEGVLVHNCHHGVSDGWSKIALHYKDQGVYGIGLTATPVRSDGLPLGDVFDALVCPISMAELIEQGFLVPYELVRPRAPLRRGQIAQRPVDAWMEHAKGRKTIVFAANIPSGVMFRDQFRDAGVSAEIVTGSTPSRERTEILRRYADGKITVLCNVGVLTEGFDDPPTSCIILARSVGSVGLYLQIFGRGLRISPKTGKTDAILIDLYGSSYKHGPPDEEREFTLDGDGIRRKKALDTPPGSFCKVCAAVLEPGVTICVECGHESDGQKPPEVVNAPLVKYARMRKQGPTERTANLRKWLIEAREKGFAKWQGAALHKYRAVYGDWPEPEIKIAAMGGLTATRTLELGQG